MDSTTQPVVTQAEQIAESANCSSAPVDGWEEAARIADRYRCKVIGIPSAAVDDTAKWIASDIRKARAALRPEQADRGLVDAASGLLARMSGTYQARNGRHVGIEADDGEKCWIVHSDDIEHLRAALAKLGEQP